MLMRSLAIFFLCTRLLPVSSGTKDTSLVRVIDVTMEQEPKETFPESLELLIEPTQHSELQTILRIKKDVMQEQAPVFVTGSDGKIRTVGYANMNYASYHGVNREGSFIVGNIGQRGSRIKRNILGHYIDTSGQSSVRYVIEPVTSSSTTSTELEEDGVIHTVRKTNTTQNSDQKRQEKANYGVELFAVVDYSSYKYWLDNYKDGALEKATEYFSLVVHGIDLRYRNIVQPDFSIYVRLVGIYIAEKEEDSPWTDGSKTRQRAQPRDFVDAAVALDDVIFWVSKHAGDFPNRDHVMLFTAMDIHNNGKTYTAGLAYTGQICKFRGSSIVEAHGGFRSIGLGAHELGHSLGAIHDGEGNDCAASDQYIMSARNGEINNSTITNPFHFSDCSISEIRTTIKSLTYNCLINKATHHNLDDFNHYVVNFPGQLYDADEQCSHIYGPSFEACVPLKHQFCNYLWCRKSRTKDCKTILAPAARGTSCDDKKWCLRGSCVYDEKAP